MGRGDRNAGFHVQFITTISLKGFEKTCLSNYLKKVHWAMYISTNML